MRIDLPAVPVFISYSTKEKQYGSQVKAVLSPFGFDCFLAHEDLEVSEEWKQKILQELLRCDIFIPLLSKAFRASDWAPQEIGVVASRNDVAIIPLCIDETHPFGFIHHIQGKRIPPEGITEDFLLLPITKRYPHKLIPSLISLVASSGSYRSAEANMKRLHPHFASLNDEELATLVSACISNGQIWSASKCRGFYIPHLLSMHEARINPKQYEALEYQVENDVPFQAPEA